MAVGEEQIQVTVGVGIEEQGAAIAEHRLAQPFGLQCGVCEVRVEPMCLVSISTTAKIKKKKKNFISESDFERDIFC